MSSLQDRLVLGALLLEEASWLFALAGVIGLMLGAVGSPMTWVAMLAVSFVSLLVVRFLQYLLLPTVAAYVVQMITGVVVVYLVVGTQVEPTVGAINFGWLATLAFGEGSSEFISRAVMGSFAGAFLWWRGGHLAAMELPENSLSGSFKVGILAFAIATLTDIFHTADLNIFPVMFVFFAASIAGMSIAHLAPASVQATGSRAWTRVIGIVVVAVLAIGLLFSLLQGSVLSVIASPVVFVLNAIATVVFIVIIMPLAFLVDLLARWLYGFIEGAIQAQPGQETLLGPIGLGAQLEALRDGTTEEPVAELLLQVFQWSLAIAIVIGVLFLMAKAFRRRQGSGGDTEDGMRVSIAEEVDAASDFAKLLLGLLPSGLRRNKKTALGFRMPSGDPNIVDVFRIYFGMLLMADERGKPRLPNTTPSEHQASLASVLSPSLVRKATAAFVRACYGHHPSSRQEIDEMRAELDEESKQKK